MKTTSLTLISIALLATMSGCTQQADTSVSTHTNTKETVRVEKEREVVKPTTVVVTASPAVSKTEVTKTEVKVQADKPKEKPIDKTQISQSDLQKSFAYTGEDASISGNNCRLNLTGKVGALSISGNNNDVTVSSLQQVTLSGTGNHLHWSGSAPKVTDQGNSNQITPPIPSQETPDATNSSEAAPVSSEKESEKPSAPAQP